MNELILHFKALRKRLDEQSRKQLVKDTFVGQAHLASIVSEIVTVGKLLERNGIDIEQINDELKKLGY